MNLQELNNQPKYYKVLEKVKYSKNIFGYKTGEKDKMVGKILQVKNIDFSNGLIFLWDEKKEYHHAFYQDEVQLITPIEFNGQLIGIGDWVKDKYHDDWFEIYDHLWKDNNGFVLAGAYNGNYYNCQLIEENTIEDHQPLYQPEQRSDEQQSAEVLDLLEKKVDKIGYEDFIEEVKRQEESGWILKDVICKENEVKYGYGTYYPKPPYYFWCLFESKK